MPYLKGTHPDDIDPDDILKMSVLMVGKEVNLMQLNAENRPLDWRLLSMEWSDESSRFQLRGFVRSTIVLTDDLQLYLASFSYASDEFSFGPALAANPMVVEKGMRNVIMEVSLTHNVSFHDPRARIDQWIVLERETSWGAEGRVLVHQPMWAMESGRLVTQEALIR